MSRNKNQFQKPMIEKIGHYSLLQYIPVLNREEGINCGVMLVVPAINFLDIMTIDTSVRLLSVYNEQEGSSKLRANMKSIKKSVLEHKEKMLSDGTYNYLPVRNFENFRFCPFRNYKVEVQNPSRVLENLFDDLVDTDEDSMLVNAAKVLLDHVSEDLFMVENSNHKNIVGNVVSFRRATEILEAADKLRDIIED